MGQQFGNRMLNLQIKKLKSNKVNKYQVRAEREREGIWNESKLWHGELREYCFTLFVVVLQTNT